METLLYIGTQNFPPQSARNCQQMLHILDTSALKRDINGDSIKLRGARKLWTKITCTDEKIPALVECALGEIIEIGCIQHLWKKVTPNTKITLKHKPCARSVKGHDKRGDVVATFDDQQTIAVPSNVECISYRPWLHMMITKLETQYEEWNMVASWMLEAEEI